ncbi:MAG: tyrosine-type recombinase/integrase [Planctomycetia bacterium]|nr:tyrosine-type recombinase/integrase [Planctomycetia bacterium]
MAIKNRLANSPWFPLSRHRNGQWCAHIWDSRQQRSRTYYFGAIAKDPTGKVALYDPAQGYFARLPGIEAGTDHLARSIVYDTGSLTLGDLVRRYLQEVKNRVDAHELSLRTLDSYLRELTKFAGFIGTDVQVSVLRPEHFARYMEHLTRARKLGNCARRRVRTDITAMLNFGQKNGWYAFVPTGAAWRSPPIDRASLRQARMRAGKPDYSDRLPTGKEIKMLLARATPSFKAIILLMINAGLGPADIGRLKWRHLDLERGRLIFPRPKTGVERRAYIWKKTRLALRNVQKLKRVAAAIAKDGEDAPVFISEQGNLMYRESLRTQEVEVDGVKCRKVVGVKVENAVSITVRRLIKITELPAGLKPYALRHAAKTYAKASRDPDAVNLMMGHQDRSIPGAYDHERITWRRMKRVALAINRKLWNRAGLIKPPAAAKQRSLPPGAGQNGECGRPAAAVALN